MKKSAFINQNIVKRQDLKTHLCLQSKSEYWHLPLSNILFLKADGNYTEIFLKQQKIQAYKVLKIYEKRLPSYFLRIHKSYIINTSVVQRLHFGKSYVKLWGYVDPIPIGKTYIEQTKRAHEHIKGSCC